MDEWIGGWMGVYYVAGPRGDIEMNRTLFLCSNGSL